MLIGLTGYARSGKDSTYAILSEYGFKRYAFADALRQMALATDPYISLQGSPVGVWSQLSKADGSLCEYARYSEILDTVGYEVAKSIPDFRRYLQRLGTDGVRDVFGDDAWVDALDRVLLTSGVFSEDAQGTWVHDGAQNATVTDVRFPNEATYIHTRGGQLWRITRPGFGGNDPHPSEQYIASLPSDVDIVATNLDELRTAVLDAYLAGRGRA